MSKTGHSLTQGQDERRRGRSLAGEMSGHIFFGEDFFGHDDAIYASACFAAYLSRAGPAALGAAGVACRRT